MSLESSFAGKRVLITGASKGIGRALAVRLHGYGASVVALANDQPGLDSLKQDCAGTETVAVDLADWDATRAAVQGIGPVDSLINNAAVCVGDGFFNITPEIFDSTMAVNVKAVINVSQVVAQAMIDSGKKGTIVNISTVAALRAFPNASAHSVSKAALDFLTKLMANELGPKGIRVNSVILGSVMTDMLNSWFADLAAYWGKDLDQIQAAFLQRVPLQKPVLEMDDAVNTILFTLSDLAAMTSGTHFVVDGGFCTT